MRVLLVLALLAPSLAATPAAAAPPSVEECWWVVDGPSIYSRFCVDSSDPDCPVYHERWYWEGGYRKTCYP